MSDRISIRDLTTQLEKNDGSSLPGAFSGKFEEERFRDLDAIRKLNQADLKDGTTNTTLQIKHDFYTTANISVRATHGADEFMGGKMLYEDSLSVDKLQHSNSADKVPANRQPIDAAALTASAENGDGKALEIALNGKFLEERASILKDVQKQNLADLAAHKTEARLDISLGGPKLRGNTMSVVRALPTTHDYWMGGVQIYSESLDPATNQRQILSKTDHHT